MSLNSLHLCLTDTKTRTRHLTEQCEYLASRKAMAEEAEPAVDEHTVGLTFAERGCESPVLTDYAVAVGGDG